MLYFGDSREPLLRNRIALDQPRWSWSETLGAARPGDRYRVVDLVFSPVRDRCGELGIREGDEVRCLGNQQCALELQRADGRRVSLERDHAWFVQVEPVGCE